MDQNTWRLQFGLVCRSVLTDILNEESSERIISVPQRQNIPSASNITSELISMNSSTVGCSNFEVQPANFTPHICELSERIKSQIRCQFCDKTPEPDELYQCPWGHLLCMRCTFRLIGNANFYNKKAKCQTCLNVVTWDETRLNVSLRLVMEIIKYQCPQCDEQLEYNQLELHKMETCPNRVLLCKYRIIGCNWKGTFNQSVKHQATCSYKEKKACDLLNKIKNYQKREQTNYLHFNILFKRLSSLAVKCIDLELKVYRSWTTHHIFFKTNSFRAFNFHWFLSIFFMDYPIEGGERQRKMSYCLKLADIRKKPIKLSFCLMSNPKQPIAIVPKICNCTYSNNRHISNYNDVYIRNMSDEINKILTLQKMMIRFYMFLR